VGAEEASRVTSILLGVALLAYLFLHFVVFVMCGLKGKYGFGVLAFFVPLVGIYPAFSLARPESWWARHRYDPQKLARAEQRHAHVGPKPAPNPQDSLPWEDENPAEMDRITRRARKQQARTGGHR
jgi:hypothetical protein